MSDALERAAAEIYGRQHSAMTMNDIAAILRKHESERVQELEAEVERLKEERERWLRRHNTALSRASELKLSDVREELANEHTCVVFWKAKCEALDRQLAERQPRLITSGPLPEGHLFYAVKGPSRFSFYDDSPIELVDSWLRDGWKIYDIGPLPPPPQEQQ